MKTNTLLRRLIVSALCAAMVISMLPVTVFANRDVDDSENNPPPPATEYVEPTVPGSTSAPRYILQFVMGEDGYASNNGSVTVSYTTNSGTGSVTVDLYEGYMKLFPNYSYSNLTKDVQRLADKGMAVNGTLIDGIAQSFTGTYYDTTERNLDAYSTYTVSLDNIPYGVTSIDSVSVSLDDKDSLSLQSLQVISVTSWLLYADTDTHSLDYLRRYWNGSYGSELVGSWSGQLVAEASGTCNGGTTTTFSTKNNKLTYYSNNRTVVDNSGSSMQGVSIHIADFYDAGIESLLAGYSRTEKTAADSKDKFNAADFLSIGKQAYSAYSNLDPIIKDCLTLEVTYLDTMGHTRKVKIPFITAYLTNILLANKGVLCGNDDYNTWISGIFQQNETVALQLRLAQYESLVGLKLTYGETVDYAASRGNAKTVNTSTDKLTVDSICFYENVTAQNFTLPYDKSHLACMLETDLTPAYSYTSSNSAGATLATGHQLNVTLENGRLINGGPEEKELENTYVFTLTNSSVSSAGTLSSIHLDITYVDNNGFEHTLEDLNLENLVGQFYGYTFNFDVLAWKKANVAGNYDGSQADNRNRDLIKVCSTTIPMKGGLPCLLVTMDSRIFTIRHRAIIICGSTLWSRLSCPQSPV